MKASMGTAVTATAIAFAILGGAHAASAKPAAASAAAATPAATATPASTIVPSSAPSPASAASAPAGHPGPLPAGADTAALPPGHPTTMPADDENEDDTNVVDPNGANGGSEAAAHANVPGIFQPPEDLELEAPDLPAGTIAVQIVDADGRPIPRAEVTLGILHNSVAKGESREKVVRNADDGGSYIFPNLQTGSGIAYRISSPKDGGNYAATPFQLPPAKGMRVVLHVYDASPRLEDARIVMQTAVYVEMKDDRVQIEEIFAIFNFGKVSWLPPADMIVNLPPEFTAFSTQQEMSDTGADPSLGKGVKLHGTFGPGRHDVAFRWQLPYDGASEVSFAVGLPPHVASSRVIAAAAPGMHLEVADFPSATMKPDNQGTRVLQTEKTVGPSGPALSTLHVSLRDLPTAGPGRFIATGLSSVGVLAGLAFVFGRRRGGIVNVKNSKGARKVERTRLLAEIEDLERAFRAGDIGPKTYERARRELIELLATTLAADANADAPTGNARKSNAES